MTGAAAFAFFTTTFDLLYSLVGYVGVLLRFLILFGAGFLISTVFFVSAGFFAAGFFDVDAFDGGAGLLLGGDFDFCG